MTEIDSTHVILVDPEDNEIGICEKTAAHREGRLHRAYSVFLFDSRGRCLLQKRADHKYHSPGLWSNTCCSHPSKGEDIMTSAKNRLKEEMGVECDIGEASSFTYEAHFDNGLIEYEIDHVFVGLFDGTPVPDPREVSDWKWADPDDLRRDMINNRQAYTQWFFECFDKAHEETTHTGSRPKGDTL